MAWWDKDNKDNKDKNNNNSDNNDNKNNDTDIELKPAEVKAKLDKLDVLESKVAQLDDMKKTSDRMSSFLDAQEEAGRRRKAQELADKANKNKEQNSEDWITDPQKAFNDSTRPLVENQLRTSSRLLRKEIFDENPAEFEFYTGRFKDMVDAHINALPLTALNDPDSIKNCYYVVYGKMQKEIKEGTVKSKFSSASDANARKGEDDKDKDMVLTDEEKRAAKAFGMDEKSYAESKKEMNYV